MPYSAVLFRMTLSELAKYSTTRSLSDSWAICFDKQCTLCYQKTPTESLSIILNQYTVYHQYRALRECKTMPTQKLQPKVIHDSNQDFNLDVCWICPKMLCMYYLVSVGHFAKYGTNRLLIVWEMLTNVQKFPIRQWWKKIQQWSGIHTWIQIATKS